MDRPKIYFFYTLAVNKPPYFLKSLPGPARSQLIRPFNIQFPDKAGFTLRYSRRVRVRI